MELLRLDILLQIYAETHAATGTNCIASACVISNTIASQISQIEVKKENKVTVEHPLGSIDCFVETAYLQDNKNDLHNFMWLSIEHQKNNGWKIYIPENINDTDKPKLVNFFLGGGLRDGDILGVCC